MWENGPYWATKNIGASKIYDAGYYFYWGDIVGCKLNTNKKFIRIDDGSLFSFEEANCPTEDKDNATLLSEGYIDESGNLTSDYDAATLYLGSTCHIPTR